MPCIFLVSSNVDYLDNALFNQFVVNVILTLIGLASLTNQPQWIFEEMTKQIQLLNRKVEEGKRREGIYKIYLISKCVNFSIHNSCFTNLILHWLPVYHISLIQSYFFGVI